MQYKNITYLSNNFEQKKILSICVFMVLMYRIRYIIILIRYILFVIRYTEGMR